MIRSNRTAYEREHARRERAADIAKQGLPNELANRTRMRQGIGDVGGGGVINRPEIDPETGDWILEFDGWTPDRDVVGEVNLS